MGCRVVKLSSTDLHTTEQGEQRGPEVHAEAKEGNVEGPGLFVQREERDEG